MVRKYGKAEQCKLDVMLMSCRMLCQMSFRNDILECHVGFHGMLVVMSDDISIKFSSKNLIFRFFPKISIFSQSETDGGKSVYCQSSQMKINLMTYI